MAKISRKLVVYLDQNFISNMAKAGHGQIVAPDYKKIYELLHQGFKDEKLVIPRSFFHDLEISLKPILQPKFSEYQGYLGQIKAKYHDEILEDSIVKSAYSFIGHKVDVPLYTSIFKENPDKRVYELDIVVQGDYGVWDYDNDRKNKVAQLNKTKTSNLLNLKPEKQQYEEELEARRHDLRTSIYKRPLLDSVFSNDPQLLENFLKSDLFKNIPQIDIFSKMWSKLMTQFPGRPIEPGDWTDIAVISSYLPYVDVLCTDGFMSDLIKQLKLDKNYNTVVHNSRKIGLSELNNFLVETLDKIKPINEPDLTVFVLSDEKTKKDSINFFRSLLKNPSLSNKWTEFYAFDDGNMPEFYLNGPNIHLPFYGMEFDIKVIKLDQKLNREKMLKKCKAVSRSKKFVLIDKYFEINAEFFNELLNKGESHGFKLLD